jgi:hypothetical protein
MIVSKGYKFRLNTSPAMEALLRPIADILKILREGLSRLACPKRVNALTRHRETVLSDLSRKQEIRSRPVA